MHSFPAPNSGVASYLNEVAFFLPKQNLHFYRMTVIFPL